MVWRISITLAGAILFSIIIGVFEVGSKMLPFNRDKVVATVNQQEIYESQLQSSLESTTNALTENGPTKLLKKPRIKKQMERNALEKLIHNELLLQAAKKEDYKISGLETNKQIEVIKSNFNNEQEFKNALQKYNLSHQQFEEKVEEELIIATYLNEKIGDITVSKDELKKAMAELDGQKSISPNLEKQVEQELITKIKQEKIQIFIEQLKKKNKIEIHI